MENATITLLKEKINQADALIIGAGSGLIDCCRLYV